MHIHRRGILRAGFIAAGAAVLLLGAAALAQEEERPKIFLEKKIFADTSEGKKSFYEVHTVSEGESLWRILNRKNPALPAEYASLLREFKRANPTVADPGKLKPGQKILIPSAVPSSPDAGALAGRAMPHRVVKGDNLTKLLKKQGVTLRDLPRYLEAVKEINESVRDVNRIFAGSTILIPTGEYFGRAQEAAPVTASGEAPAEAATGEEPAVALSRDVPPEPVAAVAEPAKPEAQIRPPSAPQASAPAIETSKEHAKTEPAKKEETTPPVLRPPYRGLLTDILAGLGEKLADRGTLYLPVPSGGEVVLNLEDFPVARFSNGAHALIDFRGSLPQNIRSLITETWKNYRVVSLEGTRDAGEIIHRLLQASGYHSVKEGISRPLVIGEGVSVTLPAGWLVLRTPRSLLSGEVILIKEVPEKPSGDLAAVLLYADRVGIRVLPFAADPSALEGFLVGIDDTTGADEPERMAVPPGGLAALDFALDYMGIPKKEGERLKIGGKADAFQLIVQPERTFETGGRRYVADTGKMAPALRTLVKDSGYTVFPVPKDEPGRGIFQRVLKEAGVSTEMRRDFLLSGGEKDGYAVKATGAFVTSREWLEARKVREVVFFGGRVHSATRALMRDIGVEIIEW
jgi:LysM repeat protein